MYIRTKHNKTEKLIISFISRHIRKQTRKKQAFGTYGNKFFFKHKFLGYIWKQNKKQKPFGMYGNKKFENEKKVQKQKNLKREKPKHKR